MKRIVILGSSSIGADIIERVRQHDPETGIKLISFDGHYPYIRDRFASVIARSIAPENVLARPKEFYDQNNVDVVLDKKITRINTKRKRITFEDKEQIEYDTLIITDTPENRYPDIKGTNKTGVYGIKKLSDIETLTQNIPMIDTVAVVCEHFSGLQLAAAVVQRKKEVIVISSENDFLGRHFDQMAIDWLTARFLDSGIRVMRGNKISEILGDKDTKAVRLGSEKVLSAQAVIFEELDEDLRLLSDSDLKSNKKILVNHQFRTNIEDVYAVDQTCDTEASVVWKEPIKTIPILSGQSDAVVAAITGREAVEQAIVPMARLNIDSLNITVIGNTDKNDLIQLEQAFKQEAGTFSGLYYQNDALIGSILVNLEHEVDRLMRQIADRGLSKASEAAQSGSPDISTELIDK